MTEHERTQPEGDIHVPKGELDLHHHTELPETALSRTLDGLIVGVGQAASWLWLPVVAVILVSVISRYAFGQGSILLEELSWHIYGVAWPLGLAYTLATDDHVRVDVLHERFSLRAQAWIELLGLVLLLLPFLILSIYYGAPYAYDAFTRGEASQAPSGLPYRFFLKSFIPLSLALLAVAAFARLTRCTALLFGFPRAHRRAPSQ
ncbi:TRAP transporter small permease subunit [Arhodomonas sp. AD133]|uniref:TRAP transporter small permease subunit n=1 Tax=Arhodomonas sp. AD133 TaxID=3415009 RepID=UPI003EBE327F